jgi:hypothetical protein
MITGFWHIFLPLGVIAWFVVAPNNRIRYGKDGILIGGGHCGLSRIQIPLEHIKRIAFADESLETGRNLYMPTPHFWNAGTLAWLFLTHKPKEHLIIIETDTGRRHPICLWKPLLTFNKIKDYYPVEFKQAE